MKKIILIGNPNVGKSVIFSRLTGAKVIISNYPGTTVEFAEGIMHINHEDVKVIDVPGTYTLKSANKAEEVAVNMLDETFKNENKDDSVVVNIIDATNLERSLNLTLQLIKRKIPLVLALNFWDETKHTGVDIDIEKLEKLLKVPCVPTVAVTGEGIKKMVDRIKDAKAGDFDYEEKEKWHKIGDIVQEAQKLSRRHHTFLDKLADISISPFGGIPIAMGVAYISLKYSPLSRPFF